MRERGRKAPVTGTTRSPASEPSRADLNRVLALQRRAGNRAVGTLARADKPSKSAGVRTGGKRVIVIDGNILEQINRGNKQVAEQLKSFLKTEKVYISHWAYQEVVSNRYNTLHGKGNEQLIKELKIDVTAPAAPETFAKLQEANKTKNAKGVWNGRYVLSAEKDARVAADALQAGGEVWSADDAFRKNGPAVTKHLGVGVAPESKVLSTVGNKANKDVRIGRKLMGLPEDLSISGEMTNKPARTPPVTSGPKVVVEDTAPRGQVTKAKTTTHVPSGEVVSGEIGGRSPHPGGGGAAPAPAKATREVASEAVEGVARNRKLGARIASKVGKVTWALIDGLVPDPLDAIELLINYAEAFEAAKAAVRKRNLEKGFATGWACYLLFPTWERAQTFARTHVEKDVITQVIDAVGVAENAYNEGLVRGFLYGEKHSTAQLNRVRQRALDAVHRSGRTVEGYYLGDGVYQFVRDDVYLFAGTLLAATREVLAESERRKEMREEVERLKRDRERIERDYEIDMARK
jgi:hypothetical protein